MSLQKLISAGYLDTICNLALSLQEPLALNALWALKNLTYHTTEPLKLQVMAGIGYRNMLV